MTTPAQARGEHGRDRDHRPGRLPGDIRLTEQRTDILVRMANGYTSAEIAAQLWLSEEAIKSHVRVIFADLGARDRSHAVAIGLVRGLVRPDQVHLPAPRGHDL
jgi:DNA-binding CsgD family transcriptional regulator